jgi:hypothetical protein
VTPPRAVSLTVVDDDVGGPYPTPPREVFPAALREAGVQVLEEGVRREAGEPPHGRSTVLPLLCVYSEPRAWKGRAGLSREARARVRAWVQANQGQGGVVAFGGPTLRADLPAGLPTLLAWGGEPLMQTAAALRIAGAPPAGFEPRAGGAPEAR